MLALPLLLLAPACCQEGQAGGDLVISADVLHVGDGRTIENVLVTVSGGRVAAVATGVPPTGSIDIPGAEITPGLVDCYSYMGVGGDSLDQSRESVPSHRVALTADLDSPAFRRALEEGVTAAYLSPDSLDVIGGLGALVKTSGGRPANLFANENGAARVLNDSAALKITIGSDPGFGNFPPRGSIPYNLYARRPTTRMGTVWTIRWQFHQARVYRELRAAGRVPLDLDLEVLVAVLEGRIPVRVQARRSHDVQTALRLQEELDWPRLLIEEGTEAHLCAGLLAEADVPVAAGRLYDEASRSVARGMTLAEFQDWADPPPVCCEDLDPDLVGDHVHVEEWAPMKVEEPWLDLLYLTLPRYSAVGVNVGRRSDRPTPTPALARLLSEAGVACALGSAEGHDSSSTESSVIHQARTAVRNGLDPEQALVMATSAAARLCGAGDALGTIESGKDADLVVWTGPPLDHTSRPLLVIVDGRVVVDHRDAASDR